MSRLPFDPKLFGICAAAGLAASLLGSLVARIASSDWRTNQTFFFAALLCLFLAGLYTWLSEKQKDAAKIVPPALLVVFCLFIPADFSDARGNPEAMERFWSALPSFLGIVATSGAMIWRTWVPVLRAWAKKPEPVAEGKPAAKRASGSKPKPKRPPPEPEPAPDPTPPDAAPSAQDEDENTVEERAPEPRVSRPEIVIGLPRRRK